jgi:predicted nucleotidyltransferase
MKPFNETLNIITDRLVNEFRPERIFLFGSHVWGSPDRDSDLDLLVIIEKSDLSPSKRASLAYHCLRDIQYPLDVMVKTREEVEKYSNVPAALEFKILNKGRLLYG